VLIYINTTRYPQSLIFCYPDGTSYPKKPEDYAAHSVFEYDGDFRLPDALFVWAHWMGGAANTTLMKMMSTVRTEWSRL
jgi:hypothetical protein